MSRKLTAENFKSGFLIDPECMAGITEEKTETRTVFAAFVLHHASGEYLGYRHYDTLSEALNALNQIPRDWTFESTSGCGGERCGEGKCKGAACKLFNGGPTTDSAPSCSPGGSCS